MLGRSDRHCDAPAFELDAGTLPDSSVRLLAGAVRLGFHEFPGAREVTLRELAALLVTAPVVAFGFFAIPSLHRSIKHAVTIFALVGDGTNRGTTIKLIDPAATINPSRSTTIGRTETLRGSEAPDVAAIGRFAVCPALASVRPMPITPPVSS